MAGACRGLPGARGEPGDGVSPQLRAAASSATLPAPLAARRSPLAARIWPARRRDHDRQLDPCRRRLPDPLPFTDIAGSQFKADILWLYNSGIISGCTATTYCPLASVTRGQMAAFLDRALHLPGTTTDYFSDDNGTIFETDINRLAASGITTGCTATTFCPNADVTRGQMAAFLDRTVGSLSVADHS